MQLTTEQQKTLDRIRLFAGSGVNNPKWALELLDIIATLQQPEPPVTDATFKVGDRVRDIYTEEVGTVKSIARNEQWQEGDLFSPHWFTVDFDKSGTKSIGGNYIKADAPVTDERATFDPTANYVKVKGGWERRKAIVIETEECLRCGKEVQYRSDLSERQLCAGCEAALAASDGAE